MTGIEVVFNEQTARAHTRWSIVPRLRTSPPSLKDVGSRLGDRCIGCLQDGRRTASEVTTARARAEGSEARSSEACPSASAVATSSGPLASLLEDGEDELEAEAATRAAGAATPGCAHESLTA